MIDIHVNGEAHRVPASTSVLELLTMLDVLGRPDQAMALAVNRCVVPRQQWPQHRLAASDRVDIVRAIGGG